MAVTQAGPRHTFPTRFTAIKFGGGSLLFVTLDIGGFSGCFNTLDSSGSFSAAPQDKSNTSRVDWHSESKDVKIMAYMPNGLEFTSTNETLVFRVPKAGAFRIDVKARNPMKGNAVAAIFNSTAKGYSIWSGEKLTDDVGGVGTLSQPTTLPQPDPTKPVEVDPESCNWGFPSAYVIPSGAESAPDSVAGMFRQYGVNKPGDQGDYGDVTAAGDSKTKTDRSWKRATKLYQPGQVDDYETVIKYGDGLDTEHNGAGVEWTMYIVYKGGKLKISNTPPPPPPPPA